MALLTKTLTTAAVAYPPQKTNAIIVLCDRSVTTVVVAAVVAVAVAVAVAVTVAVAVAVAAMYCWH